MNFFPLSVQLIIGEGAGGEDKMINRCYKLYSVIVFSIAFGLSGQFVFFKLY
jgi:hypothetical protein